MWEDCLTARENSWLLKIQSVCIYQLLPKALRCQTCLVCITQLQSVGCIHVHVWQSIVIRVHYSPMVANPVITAQWLKCCWFSLQHDRMGSSCHRGPHSACCCVSGALWWFEYSKTVDWRGGKSGEAVWTYYRHDVIRPDGGQPICETRVHYKTTCARNVVASKLRTSSQLTYGVSSEAPQSLFH